MTRLNLLSCGSGQLARSGCLGRLSRADGLVGCEAGTQGTWAISLAIGCGVGCDVVLYVRVRTYSLQALIVYSDRLLGPTVSTQHRRILAKTTRVSVRSPVQAACI